MKFISLNQNEMKKTYGGVYDVQIRQFDRLLMWLLTGYWMT